MSDSRAQVASRIRAMLRKHGAETTPTGGIPYTESPSAKESVNLVAPSHSENNADDIIYNEHQQEFIDTVEKGFPCVLTGAAGTGKTTTVRGAIQNLIYKNKLSRLPSADHKWLQAGSLSVAAVSFTNKAVQNLKKALPKELHQNCMTIHKLLEFEPDYYVDYNPETGEDKTTMRFLPSRNETNPLPHLDILIIDESTMVSVDLWNTLVKAIMSDTQVILIGDIHQLPPVFGKSIFIWAMQAGAKVVELTHVYRQALDSPIISLATRIRQGKQIPQTKLDEFSIENERGKVYIRPWKKKLSEMAATVTIKKFLAQLIDDGSYDPMVDVILTPFNKSFGTVAMNEAVATHLASKEEITERAEVWEIFAGINKKYFRIGDKVLHNKSEAIIIDITKNKGYYGKMPRHPSTTLDYAGLEHDAQKRLQNASGYEHSGMNSEDSIDAMLAQMGAHVEDGKQVSREASHKIKLYLPDVDSTTEISGSGDVGKLDLGYAITVHKSQGSEYERVFLITHGSQSNMFFRELIYTAVTRASKELFVICEPNFFVKGITTQRVPGNTLEDKIKSFNRSVELSKGGSEEMPERMSLLVAPNFVSNSGE